MKNLTIKRTLANAKGDLNIIRQKEGAFKSVIKGRYGFSLLMHAKLYVLLEKSILMENARKFAQKMKNYQRTEAVLRNAENKKGKSTTLPPNSVHLSVKKNTNLKYKVKNVSYFVNSDSSSILKKTSVNLFASSMNTILNKLVLVRKNVIPARACFTILQQKSVNLFALMHLFSTPPKCNARRSALPASSMIK
jgi:hypothetical protein